MVEKTIWICDGCDRETVVKPPMDWKKIGVKITGFHGYPVGDDANIDETFHLCPSCQKELARGANPYGWDRVSQTKASP